MYSVFMMMKNIEEHFLGNIRVDRKCLKKKVSKRLSAIGTKGREVGDERLNLLSLGFHI